MSLENYAFKFLKSGHINDFLILLRYLRINKYYYLSLFFGLESYPYYSFNHEVLNELAICMHYIGKFEDSWSMYNRIFSMRANLTADHLKVYSFNSNSNFEYIFKDPRKPTEQTIKSICENNYPSHLITFSITTCKRYDLFEKTMNSFIEHCTDLHLIKRWICVDDNSCDEDRIKMQKNYPFFEFIWKTPEQKGHAKSMNIIMEMVDTPYVFHMEDDWQFFISNSYLSNCMEVLQESEFYGQCLINKNYAETAKDVNIIGAEIKNTSNQLRYFEHVYELNIQKFTEKYGYGPNCAYWPHYSLRPGLNKMNAIKIVGEYKYGVSHFEMEFANRYCEKGYKTVFLERISMIHIGKLTNDKSIPNAYDLNEEKQF